MRLLKGGMNNGQKILILEYDFPQDLDQIKVNEEDILRDKIFGETSLSNILSTVFFADEPIIYPGNLEKKKVKDFGLENGARLYIEFKKNYCFDFAFKSKAYPFCIKNLKESSFIINSRTKQHQGISELVVINKHQFLQDKIDRKIDSFLQKNNVNGIEKIREKQFYNNGLENNTTHFCGKKIENPDNLVINLIVEFDKNTIVFTVGRHIYIFNLKSNNLRNSKKIENAHDYTIENLELTENGNLLISKCKKEIKFWDIKLENNFYPEVLKKRKFLNSNKKKNFRKSIEKYSLKLINNRKLINNLNILKLSKPLWTLKKSYTIDLYELGRFATTITSILQIDYTDFVLTSDFRSVIEIWGYKKGLIYRYPYENEVKGIYFIKKLSIHKNILKFITGCINGNLRIWELDIDSLKAFSSMRRANQEGFLASQEGFLKLVDTKEFVGYKLRDSVVLNDFNFAVLLCRQDTKDNIKIFNYNNNKNAFFCCQTINFDNNQWVKGRHFNKIENLDDGNLLLYNSLTNSKLIISLEPCGMDLENN